MPCNYQAIIESAQIERLDTSSPQTTPTPNPKKRKLGFMQGELTLPDDINWGDKQIQHLFDSH